MSTLVRVPELDNAGFFEKYAAPGRIGLVGGTTLIDRAISRAQRHLDDDGAWSRWSHAFLFQGRRADDHHWVIESDLQILRKHVQLGVQENRVAKYAREEEYANLAVIDTGLDAGQVNRVLAVALELVADRTRYSLRELLGTLVALRNPALRAKENLLARDHSLYCSAFVRHVFQRAGVDLLPGVGEKNTAPEDLFRCPGAATIWLRERVVPASRLGKLREQVGGAAKAIRSRVRARR